MVASRLVLLLFLTAQGWDGIFTYVAVGANGLGAEGNTLLAAWMNLVGPTTALIGAKLLAAGCGIVLYMLGVHHVLAGLTLLYAVGAIGPWLVVFGGH
jgi:hypothetical protein